MFSLSPQAIEELKNKNDKRSRLILDLLYQHKKLLAAILIANNFVNVSLVFLSSYIFNQSIFSFPEGSFFSLGFQVILITLILVLFGEVFPKIYATRNNVFIANFMAFPLYFTQKLFYPLIFVLERGTNVIDKRISRKGHQLSLDEIHHAIDITSKQNHNDDEKDILKGIVNFGNIGVKQIMRSRIDVMALDIDTPFESVLLKVKESGYSRIPVYEEHFDNVKGILFIKDLIPYLNEKNFDWKQVIRAPYFVPENKKLDALLETFQEKRVHMAIVVDEYGGTSGIVTMEDVLEEIFGEINDEFDEDDFEYSQIDENTYLFEGKTLIHDFCRITDIDEEIFEHVKGEAETIGGMLSEKEGLIPKSGSRIPINDFMFVVEAADRRRIKRVRLLLPTNKNK